MSLLWLIGIIILIGLVVLCAMRARVLLDKYKRGVGSLTLADARALEVSEQRWRIATHLTSLVCLLPLPLPFILSVAELTHLLAQSFGAVVVTGLALAVITSITKIKLSRLFSLFSNDVSWANQLMLALVGFILSLIVTTLLAILLQPSLRAALLQALSK